jgi:hypothetical protein
MHELLIVGSIHDVIGEIDQKLSETTLGRSVVSKNRREGGVAERLWKALTKCLTSASVITQTGTVSHRHGRQMWSERTEGSSAQRA